MYPSPSRQKWKSFYPRYSRLNYTLCHLLGYHNQDITGKADFPFNYSTTVSTFSIFTYACAVGTSLRGYSRWTTITTKQRERQTDRQRQRDAPANTSIVFDSLTLGELGMFTDRGKSIIPLWPIYNTDTVINRH